IGACLWESNSARRGYRVRAKPLGGLIRPRPQQNRLRPLTGDERAHRNISAGHTLPRPRTSPAPKPSSPSLRAAASPTIWCVLHEAGLRWSKDRSWCETGTVSRKRKPGTVTLIDPMRSDRGRVYAGQLAGMDRRRSGPLPNDSLSGFPLASGRPSGPVPARIGVRGYGEAPEVVSSSQWPGAGQGGSEVLLRGAPSLARSRADRHPGDPPRGDVLVCWERWQEGLSVWSTLPESLPPLRMLLVLDNLFGHYSVDFVLWLFAHGIMPLYTPLVGVGIWPNRFSGFSSAGMASMRRGRRRSSPGWRRQPVAGIGSHAVHLGWQTPGPTSTGSPERPGCRWIRRLDAATAHPITGGLSQWR